MFPFLSTYDPPGTSEGSLDPLGLYRIADQLAVQLVPAVRERMQRIRFLTAMAVGAMVIEDLEDDARWRDASPYLVWEWLVVESFIRSDDSSLWGVPGTLVTRRAYEQLGYLDARSYLKTPRIFGFHGVYKRLAVHVNLIDIHLGRRNVEELVDAWARGLGLARPNGARPIISRWSSAVRRSMGEKPPRTKPSWDNDAWRELADAFNPDKSKIKIREKRYLRDLLNTEGLKALPTLWQLQTEFDEEGYREERLHNRLQQCEPCYGPLLTAIRRYEAFARSLQDAFDILKAEGSRANGQGFLLPRIAGDADFKASVRGLHDRFAEAHQALGDVPAVGVSLQIAFGERFKAFAEPMDAATCGIRLCIHHEDVQRAKSADGKRPWFDRLGADRIYVRHAYREPRRKTEPGKYLHDYRGWPIRRFYSDLS